MPVPNVATGAPITEAWGDAVADSVNALETADAAHVAASNPHPGYATSAALTAHEGAGNPHPLYATDADLAAHAAAADPHAGYQKESERNAANGYAGLDAGGKVAAAQLPAPGSGMVQTINFVIDGAGAVIATGVKGDVSIDFACTITKWTVLADASGSIVVNVWRDSYANFPPVSADLIGSPTIAASVKAQSGAIAWAVAAGDVLRFNVASAATIQRATVALTIART